MKARLVADFGRHRFMLQTSAENPVYPQLSRRRVPVSNRKNGFKTVEKAVPGQREKLARTPNGKIGPLKEHKNRPTYKIEKVEYETRKKTGPHTE